VNKRATISQVAQMAGVSRAAVSKVLRNAYGLSDEMRRKVNEAMSALNYRPQTAARGLRGSTYTIGVLLPEIRNPFFPDILDGIVHKLEGTQYQPLLGVRLSAEKNESSIVEAMMDRKLDGFIMIAPLLNHDYIANVAKYVPTVVIGRHDREGGFDTVNNDDEAGAHLAVDHLVSLGHKRIAHVSLEPLFEGSGNNPMTFRLKGYEDAMRRHGLEQNISVRFTTHLGGPEHDRALALELLSGKDRPTAIFAWMDSVALTIMSAARELGLRVPQDLSVTGYDNSHIGALSQLSLTSIDQSANLLGEKSAQLLFERMEGRAEDVSFIVPPRLVARGSAGRLGGEGGI
jgi:DNA-binding LacI/PurR family transcriptional regulator